MKNSEIQQRIIDWTGTKINLSDIDNVIWTIVNDSELYNTVKLLRIEHEQNFVGEENVR